jgi:hypothetical protein
MHELVGRHWAKWSDAQTEAGFEPLTFGTKVGDKYLLEHIAALTAKLGKIPSRPQMQLERRVNPNFPNDRVIQRRWNRTELIGKLIEFCQSEPNFADILPILASASRNNEKPKTEAEPEASENGYVYLIRAQGAHKIGCTRAPYRRAAEIANQSADGAELLHLISTDDPEGIEKYWHGRFETKRIEGRFKRSGEWFALTSDDVKAFKRRKFM